MNLWVTAPPLIPWLDRHVFIPKSAETLKANVVDVVMGIVDVYQLAKLTSNAWAILPSLEISLSLNILLTLKIVIGLILLARDTRTAMGIAGIGGLCKAVVTILIKSCTLYAVSSL